MGEPTKVIYWNTLYRADPAEQLEAIETIEDDFDPDYLCLSEVTSAQDRTGLRELLVSRGYDVKYQPTTRLNANVSEGIAIVSNAELPKVSWEILSRGRGIRGVKTRRLGYFSVQRSGSEPITIATTHKSYPFIINRALIEAEDEKLLEVLPDSRTVVGGDFNTTFGRATLERLEDSDWMAIRDPIRTKTFVNKIGKLSLDLLALDHVYATSDIADQVSTVILSMNHPSNHHPILSFIR